MSYANFLAAYTATMSHEGRYSNNPADKGGETWKGIARKIWPLWGGWAIIDQAKKTTSTISQLNTALNADGKLEEMVRKFYEDNFFNALKLEQVNEPDVVLEIFDTAVNQGTGAAGKYLQTALNLLNDNGRHYKDIVVDGQPGRMTIEAYQAYMNTSRLPGRNQERNVKTLLKVLNGLQFEKYKDICTANPGQETFFYGWMNRI